jgi:uncharacterized protein (DUF2062 family)
MISKVELSVLKGSSVAAFLLGAAGRLTGLVFGFRGLASWWRRVRRAYMTPG